MITLPRFLGACLLATLALPASAQTTRGYVSINAVTQPSPPKLSDHFEFQANAETATADVRYPSKLGLGADGGAGMRLWKQFGVGIAVSYVSNSGSAEIDAMIPHPFLFGQPRSVSGTQGGITRSETAAHLQLLYFVPARGKLRAVLSGGPSFVNLQQDVVDEVVYTNVYPYDAAVFSRAGTTTAKASATGFNVGADVQWRFSRRFGVGALVRYTHATVDLDITGRTLEVGTGGVQAGAGIRIAF